MNPTVYIDVTCCGKTVRRLRLVRLNGVEPETWFLTPDGSYEVLSGERVVMPVIPGADDGTDDANRGRYRFVCETCGTDLPARAERLRTVAETLRAHGILSIELLELNGILRKS